MCFHDSKKQKTHKKERFLEICLLTMLKHKTMHGYKMLESLQSIGYRRDDLDISTLYRTLRRLEKEGQILSTWEDSTQGPNKRIYQITKSGLSVLEGYVEHMKRRIEMMKRLIQLNEGESFSC